MSKTINAILPYFGGKRTLAPRIVEELGPHRAYWELCAGSMAVLFAKPVCTMEVVVDLYGRLINLARVLASDRHIDLYDKMQRTLCSEDLFIEAKSGLPGEDDDCVAASTMDVSNEHVDAAWRLLIMSWVGRNGVSGTRGVNITPARRYTANGGSGATRLRTATESIPWWHERLRSVSIMRADMFDVLERLEDADGVVLYVDPPYVEKKASYIFDFAHDQHARLAELLRRFTRTRVVLSYYAHPLLEELYEGWTSIPLKATKALAQQGQRDKTGTVAAPEILLVNGPGLTVESGSVFAREVPA